MEPIVSHVQLEWRHPVNGRVLRGLARHFKLIRLDFRGCGLSDRRQAQTLDEYVLDIEAVVRRLGLQRFALGAVQFATLPALMFAARHPELLSRMMMMDGYARYADLVETPQVRALNAAARVDWLTATETIGYMAYGAGREVSAVHGEFIRSCVAPEFLANAAQRALQWDCRAVAESVETPTLVVKYRAVQFVTMEMSKDLVARMPDAQLTVLEGGAADDIEGLVHRVTAFLGTPEDQLLPEASVPSGTVVILFADIAGSTALTERLGDAAFRSKARELDAALRSAIQGHSGTAIEGKLLGDGVLATFTSARQAIVAALACGRAGHDARLPLHLGLHAGDVTREENNIYGGSVNIASRISDLSTPGEVLVSDVVRALARTSADVRFEDRGEQRLKGISEPVRVWAVRNTSASSPDIPPETQREEHLTAREVEILRLIAAGRTNAAISVELVLSERTVARHITNIYGKIGAHGKADATAYAIRHHLTQD